MLNHITIMGRLTRDPELRYTQSQTPVASFSLAVDRDFGSRDGGEKQTDFIDCVAWRQTAEFVSKYFQKGSMAPRWSLTISTSARAAAATAVTAAATAAITAAATAAARAAPITPVTLPLTPQAPFRSWMTGTASCPSEPHTK